MKVRLADRIENLARLDFVGAPNLHGVRLQVEPEPAQALRISQLIVEENRR